MALPLYQIARLTNIDGTTAAPLDFVELNGAIPPLRSRVEVVRRPDEDNHAIRVNSTNGDIFFLRGLHYNDIVNGSTESAFISLAGFQELIGDPIGVSISQNTTVTFPYDVLEVSFAQQPRIVKVASSRVPAPGLYVESRTTWQLIGRNP